MPTADPKNLHVKPHVLVIDDEIPRPLAAAAPYRLVHHLKILADFGCKVSLAVTEMGRPQSAVRQLAELGIELLPPGRLIDAVESIAKDINVAVLCRPHTTLPAALWLRRNAPHVNIVYDTVDVHFVRLERQVEFEPSTELQGYAASYRRVESMLGRLANRTIVLHKEDASAMRKLGANDLHVIPIIQDLAPMGDGRRCRDTITFVGFGLHGANPDALALVLREVLPLLRQAGFTGELRVIGAGMRDGVAPFIDKIPQGVEFLGQINDLSAEMARSVVGLLPLRWGGGMKGKIAMHLSHGVPVVTTPIGAEGFDAGTCLVADDAQDAQGLAAHTLRLLNNEDAWNSLRNTGRRYVETVLQPAAIAPKLLQAVLGGKYLP